MKIFVTMISIAIVTRIWLLKTKKAEKREKRKNEELIEKYGKETIALRNPNSICMIFGIFQVILVLFIAMIIGFIAFLLYIDQYESNDFIWYLLICIPLFIFITIAKTIYKKKRIIITNENIIIQSAYRKDKIITYYEINQAVQFKKIEIKRDTLIIPIDKNSIKIKAIYVKPKNTTDIGQMEIAEITELAEKTEHAIAQIKLRSKILIPEFTDSRIKHMKIAMRSRGFINLGLLFILYALGAGFINAQNSAYIHNLLTKSYCLILFGLGISGLIIGKILFVIGQYRLRKDINDPEHIFIRL